MEKEMKKKHSSMSNRLFYLLNSIVWILVMVIVLYPLYLVLISSISDPAAIRTGKVVLRPVDVFWGGYEAIFGYKELWVAYANSIFYTISHVILSLIVTMMAGYAMADSRFFGRKVINLYFVITMFFGGGLIPTFLTLRGVGLYNNRLIMIFMGCVSVWNLMLARTYIQSSIPEELYEAASIDGASRLQRILHINIPGILPTIIIMLILQIGNIASVGYEKVYLLQNDLNMEVAEVISTYVYKRGIVNTSYSFSTAVGLFNNVVNVVMLLIANAISRKYSETSLF